MNGALVDWIAIVGVALTSLVTRGSFVLFLGRLRLPPLVEHALRYAPAAVLGAIVVPALLAPAGHIDASAANHPLLAGLAGALVMRLTRSIVATLVVGMLVLTALRLWG